MLNTKQTMTTLIAVAIVSITINDSFSTPVRAHKKARAQVNTKSKVRADKNRDGIVQPKEARKAAIKNNQNTKRAVVNTKWEAKADENNDGIVQPKEAHKAAIKNNQNTKRAVVDHKWEVQADKDGNGVVSVAERRRYNLHVIDKNSDDKITAAERSAFWIKRRSKVNTLVEKNYDANADGWIDGSEAQELLRDRLRLINTHGKAKVDTALEAEYDVNQDGIIDKSEAQALKNTLDND